MALLDLTCGRVCCLCDQQCTISDAGHLQRNGTDDEEDHFCGEIHACPHTCEMEGCCDIVSAGHGHHKHEKGIRKRCCRVILPYRANHDGFHSHSLDESAQTHYCGVPCPSCGNLCRKLPGHSGLHDTKHGPMINSVFVSQHDHTEMLIREDFVARHNNNGVNISESGASAKESGQRKLVRFATGDSGGQMFTCDSYCSALGRGHTHLVVCPVHDQSSVTSGCRTQNSDASSNPATAAVTTTTSTTTRTTSRCPFQDELSLLTSGRMHRKDMLSKQYPHIDELLHETFWQHIGFEDPLKRSAGPIELALFNHCRAQCRGIHPRQTPSHKIQENNQNGGNSESSGSADDVLPVGNCLRQVSHERLNPYDPNYLNEVALLSCRFTAGTLSPTGHHFACDHPFHHYILIDSSKCMLLDDIVPSPSMKIFSDEQHTELHTAKSYQNRLGAAIELVYRYVQIRHKLSPLDRVTIIRFNSKSQSVVMDNKPVRNYCSIPDILISSMKPEKKQDYAAAFQALRQIIRNHREDNVKSNRQPMCMLVTSGSSSTTMSSKLRKTSLRKTKDKHRSSGLFKTINVSGRRRDGTLDSAGSTIHSFIGLLRDMNHTTRASEDNDNSRGRCNHFQFMHKMTIVNLGQVDSGDAVVREMVQIGSSSGHREVYLVQNQTKATGNKLHTATSGNASEAKAPIAKQVRILLGQILQRFEECMLDSNEIAVQKSGGLLVKCAVPALSNYTSSSSSSSSTMAAAAKLNWSKKDRKRLLEREKLAKEILETERSYVWAISKCLEMFYYPLSNEWSHIMDESSRRSLFSGLLSIYELHKKLLAMLERRLQQWDSMQKMGDIFVELGPLFKMYTQYTTKYDSAIAALRRLGSQVPFKNFIHVRRLDPYAQGHSLTSLLIMPIQRVPRYDLLLQNMRKETPAGHPDSECISRAQLQMKETADYLNDQITARQQQIRMQMVEARVSGISGLIKPNRWLVKDGRLQFNLPLMGTEPCAIFLFNDVLLHVSERRHSGAGSDSAGPSTSSASFSNSMSSSQFRKSRSRSMTNLAAMNDPLLDDPFLSLPGYSADSTANANHDGKFYEAKFVFQLHEIVVEDVPSRRDNNMFQLVRTHGPMGEERRFMYLCSSEEEKREWMAAIARCTEVFREQKSFFTRQQYLVKIKQDVAMMQRKSSGNSRS